jgi:hypothetical protein
MLEFSHRKFVRGTGTQAEIAVSVESAWSSVLHLGPWEKGAKHHSVRSSMPRHSWNRPTRWNVATWPSDEEAA